MVSTMVSTIRKAWIFVITSIRIVNLPTQRRSMPQYPAMVMDFDGEIM
jgi:hypothetical protein